MEWLMHFMNVFCQASVNRYDEYVNANVCAKMSVLHDGCNDVQTCVVA